MANQTMDQSSPYNGASGRARPGIVVGLVIAVLAGCGDENPSGPPPGPPPPPAGVPANMIAVDGGTQQGFAGTPVETPPSVRVVDGAGAPVAGVDVTFEADPGSGTTAGRTITTGADGEARVGSWTLGPDPGAQRVRAVADQLPTITFLAIATIPPAVFDIEIRFNRAGGTSSQRAAFRVAEARWQAVIQGEVQDLQVSRSSGFCGAVEPIDEVIDDLLILADIVPIDGPGGVLGSAGPCLLRSDTGIPVLGRMRFDVADLASQEAAGTLDDLIVHEMGHVLGIGSLWSTFHLVDDPAFADPALVSDPFFTGVAARAAFESVGGDTYNGLKVPVEDTGGGGTRLVHWRESVFGNELMTGFIDARSNPLSLVTIESLEDMGYEVDPISADFYDLSLSITGSIVGSATRVSVGDDVLRGPIYTIDEDGRIRLLRVR